MARRGQGVIGVGLDLSGARAATVASSASPHGFYRRLREFHPVHFDPRADVWFLSRHRDCAAALRDPRLSAELGQRRRRRSDPLPRSMLTTDPPDHARLRGPATAVLSPNRLERLRARVQPAAAHLADAAVRRGEFDAIAEYAGPLAVITLGTLLGLPPSELAPFARLARAASVNLDPLGDDDVAQAGRAAAAELAAYLQGVIDDGRAAPGDALDSLAGSRRGGNDGRTVSAEEALSTLVLFVVGGYEPLISLVGNGLHALATVEGAAARLRAEPGLWRSAIDEVLRWESPIPFTARVCREEVTVRGQVIPRGATVVLLLAAANRDPDVFPNPEVVDVGRHPNPMLAFGGGPHLCVAAPLARGIGQLALSAVLARCAVMTLAPGADSARWRPTLVPRSLDELRLRVVA